jgi:hypothetical protein
MLQDWNKKIIKKCEGKIKFNWKLQIQRRWKISKKFIWNKLGMVEKQNPKPKK